MVIVEMKFTGGERFVRGFEGFEGQMRDMTEALDMIAQDFYETEKDIFARGGTPEPFKPLDAKYAKWKARHFPGKSIMRMHDNLYRALTGSMPYDLDKARPVRLIKKDSMEIGFESVYGMHHQRTGRKTIQVSEETRRRWGRIIHQWAYQKYKGEVMGL